MGITVTFRHIEPTESLRLYAEEKVSKLKKYVDTPVEAHVVLEVEKFRHIADVTLNADGTKIKGVEETGDLYSAIDQVMDKIEAQLKRHRSKIREKRPENARSEASPPEEEAAGGASPALEEPDIIMEKLTSKPMDPEEAVMRLKMGQREFLAFRNSKTKEMNVIYKRRDGHYGLIEPAN
jgi:putative sigma-54 modulation protein